MMKMNIKLIAAVLLPTFAWHIHAADDTRLIVLARELAQKLCYFGNVQDGGLVSQLAERVEHLMHQPTIPETNILIPLPVRPQLSAPSLEQTVSLRALPAAPRDSLVQANEFFKAKQFKDALDMFKAIADDSSQNPANRAFALGRIGSIYRVGGDGVARNFAAALESYNLALTMPELTVVQHADVLGYIGEIYKRGGNGVVRNYAAALDNFKRALAMGELHAPNRANILTCIGDIYKIGGNGVAQNLSLALSKFQEALAVENGLDPKVKELANKDIAEITAQLQARSGSSTPAAQPLAESSSSEQTVSSGVQPVAPDVSLERARELCRAKRFKDALDMCKAIVDDQAQSPANRATALGGIGNIYKNGGGGVSCDYAEAVEKYNQALAMPALPAARRAIILGGIGYIYKNGGNGVDQNLNLALRKFQEALAVENGLTSEQKRHANKDIAEITVQLQARAGSSTTSLQPTVSSSALPAASGVSLERARELCRAKRYMDALDMCKAIANDQAQSPANRARALGFIGDIYRIGGNGVVGNCTKALEKYNQSLAMGELPAANRATILGFIGDIYKFGGNGVVPNYAEALERYNQSLAMGELPAANRATILGFIGDIYKFGGNGVVPNYAEALERYNQSLAMPALPAANRATVLSGIGNIYKIGGNGVAQNLSLALSKFQEALAVENGLDPKVKELANKNIAEITAQLQARAGSSTTTAQPSAVPSPLERNPMLIASASNKRTMPRVGQKDVPSAKRHASRTRAVPPALYHCRTCNKDFATKQRLSRHEDSQKHQDNVRAQTPLVLPPSNRTSRATTLLSDSETSGTDDELPALASVRERLPDSESSKTKRARKS